MGLNRNGHGVSNRQNQLAWEGRFLNYLGYGAALVIVLSIVIGIRVQRKLKSTPIEGGKYSSPLNGLRADNIQRLAQSLSHPNSVVSLAHGHKEQSLRELVEHCFNNPDLKDTLDHYGVSRQDLTQIYWQLVAAGAGQWIGKHYVPVAALTRVESLQYIVSHGRKNIRETAFRLIQYFAQGTNLSL